MIPQNQPEERFGGALEKCTFGIWQRIEFDPLDLEFTGGELG